MNNNIVKRSTRTAYHEGLGGFTFFVLGIEVKQIDDGIVLSQEIFANDRLTHTEKLLVLDGDTLGQKVSTGYMSIVGALHYLTLTRHDVHFAVSKVCQFIGYLQSIF